MIRIQLLCPPGKVTYPACQAGSCDLSRAVMQKQHIMFHVMLIMTVSTHLRGKRVQRQPMTNGGINVEIGNPSYNMYEVDHDSHADAGSLLRPNFTLDPHKVGLLL